MIKHFLLSLILGLTFNLFSQSQEYVMAKLAYDENDYVKAQEHIEKALDYPKSAEKSRTWLLRGDIYKQIMFSSKPEVQAISENAEFLSFESYQKAVSMDNKLKKSKVENNCDYINNFALNKGVMSFNQKQFANAKKSFELCINIADWLEKTDSLAILNLAMACERMKDYNGAIENYGRCVKLNYQRESCYENLGYCFLLAEDLDGAKVILKEAIGYYPENNSLQTSLLNIFLRTGERDQALEILDNLISENPNYAQYYSVKGSILVDLNRSEDAISALEKGLELDGESFEMNFNMGSIQFNKASSIMIEASSEEDYEKSEEIAKKATTHFELAKKYFEKAHSIKPSDRGTMEALKNVYIYTNDMDKLTEIKEKLK